MKIIFDDKSYIEISKSNTPDKVFITVAAKSADDVNKLIVNSVELSNEQLLTFMRSIS